jgi:hypothetical protein
LLIPEAYEANDSVSGHQSIPIVPGTSFSLKASVQLTFDFQEKGLNGA